MLKTEFFFLGFNLFKANSHHENIKKRKVLVACKKSFKVEASKSLFAIGGGRRGREGEAAFFLGGETRWIMGNTQMANRDLFLRDRSFVFVSFFLRCIGIKYVWFEIYIFLFQYLENLHLVEKIVLQILKKSYPKPFWKDDKAYDCQ